MAPHSPVLTSSLMRAGVISGRLMFSEREPGLEGVINWGLYPSAKALIMLCDLSVLFTSRKKWPFVTGMINTWSYHR